MPRPRIRKRICFDPRARYFKPQGIPLRLLEVVTLTLEEMEALRLKNNEGLQQEEAATHMGISQSTFQRILQSAYKKISDALLLGKAIRIEG